VDVYRSFMYLEKPVFEKVSLEPLLTRLVQLFRRATTQRIEIQTHFTNNLPGITMEPRLFKLAMFNLLTNSLDAIKKSSTDRPISGLIELSVSLDDTQKNIFVSVKDNGLGLRRSDGSALPENEIQRIFQFGYSTKEKVAGGLGLAWVYTIICEIHKGTITAKNNSSGGAEFIIALPVAI
jgi:two-component system, NtrC family, sensor kinase